MALRLDHLTDAIGFRFTGDGYIGSVAGAGDVNGDGIDDVVFGSPFADTSYIVFGTVDGIPSSMGPEDLDGRNGFRLAGAAGPVAGLGDLNGDGFADLIIGDPYASGAFVVFGGCHHPASLDLSRLDGSDGFRLDDPAYDLAGRSVAGAGDINGDGLPDLVIGAQNREVGNAAYAGSAYVVFGSRRDVAPHVDLASLDGSDGFRIDGANTYDLTGYSVAGAGDFNGDGIDDLVIGARDFANRAGAAYVLFGTTAGFAPSISLASLSGVDGFRIDGLPYDALGWSVASAGDLNGDGYGDLVIGAPNAYSAGRDGAGATYVVFGSSASFGPSLDVGALDGTNGFRIDGPFEFATSGGSVSGAGDVNGDGFADLIIGTWREAYLLFGSAAGFAADVDLASLAGSEGLRIAPGHSDSGASWTVAAAGDVNGDGIDDIAVGTGTLGTPDAYVIYGSTAMGGPNDSPVAAPDHLAIETSGVFDLTDDHGAGFAFDPDFDDLTITEINGAPVAIGDQITLASGLRLTLIDATDVRFDTPGLAIGTGFSDQISYRISDPAGASSETTVTIDYAKSAIDLGELDGTAGFRLQGAHFDYSGSSVASAGDFNGDGIGDVIIGAPNLGSDYGTAYVVFGSRAGIPSVVSLPDLGERDGFHLTADQGVVGYAVAGIGDLNGDGFDDVAIAAPGGIYSYTPGGAYVVFGSASGFPTDLGSLDGGDGFRMDQINYHYGTIDVAAAGDVNGDGIDDLLVGSDSYGTGYAGETFVVFGSTGGFPENLDLASLDASEGFRIDGIAPGDESGLAVSAAGDVNGDGLADFAIGAPGAASSAGATYVVFGSATGLGGGVDLTALDGTNGFRIGGAQPGDGSGFDISSAGDVNGDGIDDLIIGAPGTGYVDGTGAPGASYVLFGSAADFAPDVDLSALDGTNGFRIDGVGSNDNSGVAVAGAGDVNGDGLDDLLVGAPGATPGDRYFAGETFVLFGSADGFAPSVDPAGLDGQNGYRLEGATSGELSGRSVAGAGDLNGDGIDDLIVGAPGGGEYYAGSSYVIYGTRSGPASPAGTSIASADDDRTAFADPPADPRPAGSDGLEAFRTDGPLSDDHFAWL